MTVGDGGTGSILFIGGVVEDTEHGLDEEQSQQNGAENCVAAAIGLVQLV